MGVTRKDLFSRSRSMGVTNKRKTPHIVGQTSLATSIVAHYYVAQVLLYKIVLSLLKN